MALWAAELDPKILQFNGIFEQCAFPSCAWGVMKLWWWYGRMTSLVFGVTAWYS